jgi:hypothetical protein
LSIQKGNTDKSAEMPDFEMLWLELVGMSGGLVRKGKGPGRGSSTEDKKATLVRKNLTGAAVGHPRRLPNGNTLGTSNGLRIIFLYITHFPVHLSSNFMAEGEGEKYSNKVLKFS